LTIARPGCAVGSKNTNRSNLIRNADSVLAETKDRSG